MTKIKDFLSVPKNRHYLYRVIQALVVVLVALGFIVPGLDETIMILIAAVLGVSGNELASRNPSPEEQPEDEAFTE